MTKEEYLKRFGVILKAKMQDRGYSAPALARETGIHVNTIHHLTNGHFVPRLKNLLRLADALDCTVDDLVNFGFID
jgi:DNA-binding Xre family transcriptional regulator